MNYRILIFNAAKKRFQVEEIEEDYIGPLSASVHIHLNRYKSYDLDVFDPNNVICLGASILAGMGISAFNDLVISFKSPLTGGLYINNVPGLGSSLSKLNVDLIVLEGKSKAPIIIGLRGKEDGGVECYIRYLEENQVISLMETYLRLRGTKALVRYVAEKILNWFMGSEGLEEFSVIGIGPAGIISSYGSALTLTMAQGGTEMFYGGIIGGGLGSLMYKAHNVIAIAFGGKSSKETFERKSKFDVIVRRMHNVIEEYVNKVKPRILAKYTSTVISYISKMSVLNWRHALGSANLAVKELINMYARNFKRSLLDAELIACDSMCPLRCRVTFQETALELSHIICAGICGVFNFQSLIDCINGLIDLGLNPEEFMPISALILELVHCGLLKSEHLGLSGFPVFDLMGIYDGESNINAHCVLDIAHQIVLKKERSEHHIDLLRLGLEHFLKHLVQDKGNVILDLCMMIKLRNGRLHVPYPIYSLLHILPLPVKLPVRESSPLGLHSLKKAVSTARRALLRRSLHLELGICNGPLGKFLSDIVIEEVNKALSTSLLDHVRRIMSDIVRYNRLCGAEPESWYGHRAIDVLLTLAQEGNENLANLKKRLIERNIDAANEYLLEFYKLLTSMFP